MPPVNLATGIFQGETGQRFLACLEELLCAGLADAWETDARVRARRGWWDGFRANLERVPRWDAALLRSVISPVVESHPRLQRSLGAPFRVEPWWNGSVSSRGNGNLASCVYLVDGERASCDVQVVLVRAPGSAHAYVPNLVRNLAAPEQWRVARMEAILPHEKSAGLPGRVNLLQEPEPKGGVLANQKKRAKGKSERWRGVKRWFRRSKGDE